MNYSGLERAIRRYSLDDVRTILADGGLRTVADGADQMRAVRHPLGFACLPLYRNGLDGVCVHLWPADLTATLTTSEVHCHSWDLLSYVLYGGVYNQRFEPVDVTDGAHRVFEVLSQQGAQGRDDIIPTARRVELKAAEPVLHGRGEYYELPAGQFHASSVLAGQDAATLVLGTYHPEIADLTVGDPATAAHSVQRRRHAIAQTAIMARQLLARLAGPAS